MQTEVKAGSCRFKCANVYTAQVPDVQAPKILRTLGEAARQNSLKVHNVHLNKVQKKQPTSLVIHDISVA